MTDECNPCPCEGSVPCPAPHRVLDEEIVIRAIIRKNWLVFDEDGNPQISTVAFSKDDLAAKIDKDGGKRSVSLMRSATPKPELAHRLKQLNKEVKWSDDPVRAIAEAISLRRILDNKGRREICLNADPVSDYIGDCSTHVSMVRACPPPDDKQKLDWQILRQKLCCVFNSVEHLSGQKVG